MNTDHSEGRDPWKYYSELLLVVARRFAANRAWVQAKMSASDIVQETMTVAFAKRESWENLPDGQRTGWLVRVLKNVAKDKIRNFSRQKRDFRLERSLCGFVDSVSAWFEKSLEDPTPGPDQQAANRELVRRLLALLPRLSPLQREVFEAREFDELPYDEIGQCLHLTPGQVAGLLRHARRKLRQWLEEGDRNLE